ETRTSILPACHPWRNTRGVGYPVLSAAPPPLDELGRPFLNLSTAREPSKINRSTTVTMNSPFNIISNSALPMARPDHLGAPSPRAHPRPDWLRVKFFGGERYQDLKRIMRTLDLHTVCESARCPNLGECWEHGTATFMILGDICTRACGFCAVPS